MLISMFVFDILQIPSGYIQIFNGRIVPIRGTADGGTVVKVLRYKSEGRWFDSRWYHWNFSLT
jgi:hypothetical protein